MDSNAPFVANLVNSIIGVSVLAMPYCMKKCGILLGLALLLGASWLTYVSCSMLITSAVITRRRSYEYLAFHTLGPTGKLIVEMSMIGLMLGTCVAFYVIIGDLATSIFASYVSTNELQLRTFVIIFCALCIALPLGLMRNLSVLGKIGFLSLMFYFCFLLVMLYNAVANGFLTFEWLSKIELFRPAGIFQILPIFSLAYACQCQLFVLYDSIEDPTVMRMEMIVTRAMKLVTFVYCLVAIFGYTTYHALVQGNVLQNLPHTVLLELVKFGFAGSVVIGFPLMIFPCRQSIYTLFFGQQSPVDGVASKTYIEPFTFKILTLCIVLSTMTVAIFIPNVETILGLTGATMGSLICYILPAVIYSKAYTKGNGVLPKLVFILGCVLLVVCTYQNLTAIPEPKPDIAKIIHPDNVDNPVVPPNNVVQDSDEKAVPILDKPLLNNPQLQDLDSEKRVEPPNPIEPIVNNIPNEHQEEPVEGMNNEEKVPLVGADVKHNADPPQAINENRDTREKKDSNHEINSPVEHEKVKDHVIEKPKTEVVDQEKAPEHEQKREDGNNHLQEEKHEADAENNDSEHKEGADIDDKLLLEKIQEQHKKQHALLEEQHEIIEQLVKHQQEKTDDEDPKENVPKASEDENPAPVLQKQPAVNQKEPALADAEKQPIIANRQPDVPLNANGGQDVKQHPVVQKKPDAALNRQPVIANNEPVVNLVKPVEKRQDPAPVHANPPEALPVVNQAKPQPVLEQEHKLPEAVRNAEEKLNAPAAAVQPGAGVVPNNPAPVVPQNPAVLIPQNQANDVVQAAADKKHLPPVAAVNEQLDNEPAKIDKREVVQPTITQQPENVEGEELHKARDLKSVEEVVE